MKLENQVVSLDLSKRLKELGFKQDSLFWWRLGYSTSESFDEGVSRGLIGNFRDYELQYYPKPRFSTADIKPNFRDLQKIDDTEISAYTVAELGEMLPKWIYICKDTTYLCAGYATNPNPKKPMNEPMTPEMSDVIDGCKTEADARAKMLIYLKENNLI